MSHPALSAAASPKTRVNFLLDEPAPPRLPDRGRSRDAVRALSADAMLGAGAAAPAALPGRDWLPGAATRAHSADSLSSGNNSDFASLARDDSSDGGSASGGSASASSPRLRALPAPALQPTAYLLQSSSYGGVFQHYVGAPPALAAHPSAPAAAAHGAPHAHVAQQPPPLAHHPVLAPGPPAGAAGAASPAHAMLASTMPPGAPGAGGVGAGGGGRRAMKTEAQMRERHDQRKMKNRISAAASRDRKKRSFTNLQRSLHEAEMRYAEAKSVIESLTLQLEHAHNRLAAGDPGTVPVPQDLRDLCGGADFVSPQQLVDLLRAVAAPRR